MIDKYPKFKGVRMGTGITGGWKIDLILANRMKEFWKDIDPFALFELAHVLPIWDPLNAFPAVKKKISFYPRSPFLKVTRGLWLTANDHGFYNADFSTRRGNETEANIYLFHGLDALLKMIFLLNRKYYPPTKWITQEIDKLNNSFDAKAHLEKINHANSMIDRQREFNRFISEIKRYLQSKKNVLSDDEISNPWKIMKEPFFVQSTF